MQASAELQQQIDSLKTALSEKETSLTSQTEAFAADKTTLQQELKDLAQQLKDAEAGKEDLNVQQDQWKAKCAKSQQVGAALLPCPAVLCCMCRILQCCSMLMMCHVVSQHVGNSAEWA